MHHREVFGQVISDKMDKTAVVTVKWSRVHPLYQKRVRRSTRLYVHDPKNECQIGDTVRIIETRPLSKLKRWLLKGIVLRSLGVPGFVQEPEVVAEAEPEVVAEEKNNDINAPQGGRNS